jgi:molecular chaperone DnaK (HSP70)
VGELSARLTSRLRGEVEKAKRVLSANGDATVALDGLGGGGDVSVHVSL